MAGAKKLDPSDSLAVLRQHQRVLIDLARFAAEAFDLQTFIDDAVLRISAALEIDHVKLLRYRPERNDLLMEAGVGWGAGVVKVAAFATDLASPVGRCFQTAQSIMIPDFDKATEYRLSELLRAHGIVSLLNVPIMTDGAVWGVVEVDSSTIRAFSDDTVTFMTGIASLVGLLLRRMEAVMAQEAAASATTQEIRRRELLLREMQHRVKNNFQTILGMISLRAPGLPSKEGRELVARIGEGIMAMSLAHDQLSPSRTGEVIGLATYLRALAGAFAPISDTIVVEVKADEVNVSIEQAVPIGLIVNELITNSVKHAFGNEGGAVRVELHSSGRPGFATLVVADNGNGVGQSGGEGSGLKLVRALADQVRGELEQTSSDEGVRTTLYFAPRTR